MVTQLSYKNKKAELNEKDAVINTFSWNVSLQNDDIFSLILALNNENGIKLRYESEDSEGNGDFTIRAGKITLIYDADELPLFTGDLIEIQYNNKS